MYITYLIITTKIIYVYIIMLYFGITQKYNIIPNIGPLMAPNMLRYLKVKNRTAN